MKNPLHQCRPSRRARLSRPSHLRLLLLPLLLSLALTGCKPPGPRGPKPPAPEPTPVEPTPAPAPEPTAPSIEEGFDEVIVSKVVAAFRESGVEGYQTRARGYAALYAATADIVEVDKSYDTTEKVLANYGAVRELMKLQSKDFPKFQSLADAEVEKLGGPGPLTDEKRAQIVKLLRNLSEGCRRAASK